MTCPRGQIEVFVSVCQTDPPSIAICDLFPNGQYPPGQEMEYPDVWNDGRSAKDRFSTEEQRALDRAQIDMYNEVRQAAEAHRQTRKYIQEWVKPGEEEQQQLYVLAISSNPILTTHAHQA